MAEIITRTATELTIQVTVKLSGSLLDMENAILLDVQVFKFFAA